MSISTIHGLYALEIHTDDDGGATVLDGITSNQLSAQSTFTEEGSSGFYYRRFQALVAQSLTDTFATNQVADALGVCGLLGKKITATTNPGVNIYAQKHDDGGTRTSGSNHRKYNIKKGLIVPTRLTVEHQKDAMLEYTIFLTYDGTNSPVVSSDSVALPTLSGDDARWTLGQTTIGAVSVDGIRRLSIDFGVAELLESAGSDIWATHASIMEVNPVITFTTATAGMFGGSNFSLEGLAGTHANSIIYLRAREEGSDATFVANGTASHIKITAAGRITPEDILNSNHNQPAEVSFRMATKYDGTNAPIVFTTGIAIT